MLKSLRIKNYAIIDDVFIEFEDGFNVFTGETGAGKSIIVDALSLLFKGRSDSSYIKQDKDKAIIEGVFEINDDDLKEELEKQDIEYDNELIIKRVISRDNKNSIRINESFVTLNFLSELLNKYVDIHSQKDSQFLFNKANQLYLLDKYCANKSLFDEYKNAYNIYKKIENEYDKLLNDTYNEREIEFYKFDFDELDKANLSIDEEEKLENLEKISKSKEKYLNSLNNSLNIYLKDGGLKEEFYNLLNSLDLNDDEISKIKDDLNDLYYSLDDKMNDLKSILNRFDSDDLDIEKIEERLYLYGKLKRKHKCDVAGLLKIKDELKDKISFFENKDLVLMEKKKELDKAYDNALLLANKLSELRKEKALKLEKEIKKETADLLLNNCNFKINFNDVNLNSFGKDDVEFYVSLNKGENLKPLKSVASGGEVSRLMLALKASFSKISKTDLLILDEIDTGVSGNVGMAVGEKIAKISKDIQVLCITHLSPVAAWSSAHFYIYKKDIDGHTSTCVRHLNKEEIVKELASISNTSSNSSAILAAEELYNTAQNKIKEL